MDARGSDLRTIRSSRAFTLIELLVVLLIVSVLLSIVLPGLGRTRLSSKQLADAVNIRTAVQSVHSWAGNDREQFPLPSRLDAANSTLVYVSEPLEKDNSGNIFSLLLFNGYLTPQTLVSPAEINPAITPDRGYASARPELAENPALALWDPGFAGLPGELALAGYDTGIPRSGARRTGAGSLSYAHAVPFGQRKLAWKLSGGARDPLISNRGPSYEGRTGDWSLLPDATGRDSNRVRMFGGKSTWGGNVGYNDGHVVFETRPDPTSVEIRLRRPVTGDSIAPTYDNLFVNENERSGVPYFDNVPTAGSNALLQIFGNATTRGPWVEGVKDVYTRVFKD